MTTAILSARSASAMIMEIWPCQLRTNFVSGNPIMILFLTKDPDSLSEELPVEGPVCLNTAEMVNKALTKMKAGKAAGPSGIVIEIIKAAREKMAASLVTLFHVSACLWQIAATFLIASV